MIETSVTNLQFNHEWTSSRGTAMYTFDIEFADGTGGQVNSTSNNPPYAVGDTVWKEQQGTTPKGDPKFRVQKTNPNQSFPKTGGGSFVYSKPKGDTVGVQWAMNCAREVLLAQGENVTPDTLEAMALALIHVRDNIVNQTS